MPIKLPEWKKWDDSIIEDVHGTVRFYRDLYYGKHGELFPRAAELIKNGEIVDNIYNGQTTNPAGNVQTPYLIANACKVICKVPASMVSRAVGKLTLNDDQEFSDPEAAAPIEGVDPNNPETSTIFLSDILEDIERSSGFKRGAHYSNILQQQMDGGLVGIPVKDDNGVRIEFKKREIYFPHEDDLGCDLAFKRDLENMDGEMSEYLHVIRQRVEDNTLKVNEWLYELNEAGELEEVDETEAAQILEVDSMSYEYTDRNRPFVVYWANEATFDFPLGISALYGQEGKQDEINWTMTRNSIVFQRNGKPRLAVSKEIMNALQQKALDRYNDENLIDHRDLELVTMDAQGKSMEVIQIDVTKIGDIKYVKDLLKMMFIETDTSEKAVDFYLGEGGGSAAQSGVAKFYDLFTSIVKAERLLDEYVDFIQELVENCFWLMSKDSAYEGIEVVRPSINIKDMIPTTLKERVETESMGVDHGIRSKEKAVTILNERDSDTAIEQELENIAGDIETINSQSQSPLALNSLSSMLDNRAGATPTDKNTPPAGSPPASPPNEQ